jgi:hypothetical protein
MGIALSTLSEWKKKYTEFSGALKEGKSQANAEVENALYKRAVGYDYEEVKVVAVPESKKPSGKKEILKIEKTVKHVPADVAAIKLWLKNRTDHWRDVQEIEQELTGKDGGPVEVRAQSVDLSKLTDEELADLDELVSRIVTN